MDATPLLHAAFSLVIQALVGLLTGNWWLGGLVACTWWVAREHTQAEYRWIERFGEGRRSNMPAYGGFDLRVWDLASFLDLAVPTIACAAAYLGICIYMSQ